MSEILFQYHKVNPTTWVYLSSLLMLGLYFKFGRFWSVRNLDLALLILLAPGLLMAQYGAEKRTHAGAEVIRELQKSRSAAKPVSDTLTHKPLPSPKIESVQPREELKSDPSDASGPDSTPQPAADGSQAAREDAGEQSPLAVAQRAVVKAKAIERLGYFWLFGLGALLLVRLLLDPTMVRRPLLEPNLSTGGLAFIGCSLCVFLMANVIASKPADPERAPSPDGTSVAEPREQTPARPNPRAGYALLNLIPSIPTMPLVAEPESRPSESRAPSVPELRVGSATAASEVPNPGETAYTVVAKAIAILCHLAVVIGIAAIGYQHFGSMKTGVGMASLYLMLPYTAQMTGRIEHVIPAALLVGAVLSYRRPLSAGMLIGLATSLVYYPIFLLPLWFSFYWRRGLMRFGSGVVAMLLVMAVSLIFIPHASYWDSLKQMLGLWIPVNTGLEGIWGLAWNPVYRYPVLAAFVSLSFTFAMWPAQKNLGTLLSCSAAVMVATQFWHGYGGGLYMDWYLPLLLLTVFRPNLEDRVALAVLGEGWSTSRMSSADSEYKAD